MYDTIFCHKTYHTIYFDDYKFIESLITNCCIRYKTHWDRLYFIHKLFSMGPCNGSSATNSAVKVPVVSPTTTNNANRSKALALYNGNTNSLKSAYKQKLKLYEEYEEHKRNTNKAIQACFDENLFVELETDGLLFGITPIAVYQHMWTSFLLKVDKDQEILKAKELLKVDYNPDRIVQHYYKDINEAR